jgi:glycine/D-amino acid oxidase-like deaminating enzyme
MSGSTVFERLAPAPALVETALAGSVLRPFWLDDIPPQLDFAPLQGDDHKTALAIVGGGYLGLWTAILAKERDPEREVVLLEAGRIGHAASGRNGGFCEASITHGEENAQQRWPEEAELLQRLGEQNLSEFEATLAHYGMDCDFERTGLLTVAVEHHQVEPLRGPGFLSIEAVRAQLDSPTYLAGHWDREGNALVHPGKLVAELTRVAQQLGVRIHERSAVRGLRRKGRQIRLHTDGGSLLAEQVVLATNVFPSLLKRYRLHTVPVYDYVLMSEPLSPAQRAAIGWQQRQGVADMGNQFHYYRLTADQRILFGGYDAIYHFGGRIKPEYEDRRASFEALASHFLTTFPQLAGIRFTHRWAGVIDTSTRFCAFFGQAYGGRVRHANGFTGLGVGATRFAANVLLDQLDGLDTERTRLRMVRERPMPFPPEPIVHWVISAVQRALARADRNGGRRGWLLRTLDALGLGFDS